MSNADKVEGSHTQQVPPPDDLTYEQLKAQAIASGISVKIRSGRLMEAPGGGLMHMQFTEDRSADALREDLARFEIRERQRRSILRKPLTWFEDFLLYACRWAGRRAGSRSWHS
jgi:hypothetical protein